MEIIFFLVKLFLTAFIIKFIMTWIYNIVFFALKSPYIYILVAFLFNIVVFEILAYFYSQSQDTYIFNTYGLASLIALFLLIPPRNKNITKEEMSEMSDEMLGFKHSIILYRVGLFAFFIGEAIGSYIIMYQYHINSLSAIPIN